MSPLAAACDPNQRTSLLLSAFYILIFILLSHRDCDDKKQEQLINKLYGCYVR